MACEDPIVEVNMSHIPVAGLGGLGLVAAAGAMAYVVPEARLFLAGGAAGGVLVGIMLIVARRARARRRGGVGGATLLTRQDPFPHDRGLGQDLAADGDTDLVTPHRECRRAAAPASAASHSAA